jgi:hypothetical protein
MKYPAAWLRWKVGNFAGRATQRRSSSDRREFISGPEQNLTIIPVINKIDLPNAQVDIVKAEICHLIGCTTKEILAVRRKPARVLKRFYPPL